MPTFNMQATAGRRPLRALLLGAVLAAALAACGGGGDAPVATPPVTPPPVVTPPATELTLAAASTDAVAGGAPLPLTASLNGAGTVSWALAAGSPGSLSAASGATVSYTPPAAAAVNAVTQVLVSATSGSLSKTLTLTLAPDPARPGLTLMAGNAGSSIEDNLRLDGVGAAARFGMLRGVTADAAGNIYVSDYSSSTAYTNNYSNAETSRIRKIAADGTVTTLNRGERGIADGNLAQARVQDLAGIFAAADGSVYFIDSKRTFYTGSLSIFTTYARKLDTDGNITTLGEISGSGVLGGYGTAGPDGKFYVWGQGRVALLKADGSEQLLAGERSNLTVNDADGAGAAARFSNISDVAIDRAGNLYALDRQGVRKITPAGEVSTLAPLTPPAVGSADPGPTQIGIDAAGNILLLYAGSDQTYYQIRKLSGGVIAPLHQVGTPQGRYTRVALDMHVQPDGTVLLAGYASVTRIGTDGKVSLIAGLEDDTLQAVDGQGADARYVRPGLLAADQAGNVYSVEDAANFPRKAVIRKTTPSGAVSTWASADLSVYVTGMAVNPAGQLIVSVAPLHNAFGGGIYRVDAGNSYTLIAGLPGVNTNVPLQRDGVGAVARFGLPTLAGIDSAGNLYVVDRAAAGSPETTVRMMTPQGTVSTVAALPAGLGAAPDGNRYETDYFGTAVYRVAPDGGKTLVAGTPPPVVPFSGERGTELGALPGHLSTVRGIVATGPNSFAVAAGSAILRLVLPPR